MPRVLPVMTIVCMSLLSAGEQKTILGQPEIQASCRISTAARSPDSMAPSMPIMVAAV